MLPQSDFESPIIASPLATVAIAALTQDRALIGLLRSTVDPSNDLILVSSEAELIPHLRGRRVSACLLDGMFIEGDLASLAERLRENWPDLVLVVVGTAEEQSKVASQITSGVVYRFLHRPVSAPRVRLFVDAALRRHEVENVERTLEQQRPDFSQYENVKQLGDRKFSGGLLGAIAAVVIVAAGGLWYGLSPADQGAAEPMANAQPARESTTVDPEPAAPAAAAPAAAAPAEKSATPTVAQSPQDETAERAGAIAARSEKPGDARQSVAEVLRQAPPPSVAVVPPAPTPSAPANSNLRQAASTQAAAPTPTPTPTPVPAVSREQLLRDELVAAEAALQRGELATPPGRNAVELFRSALEMDPNNTLAKAGLIRVADRLLGAAERALTGGNTEDAKRMVAVAESLTPATVRGAFLVMQIEKERERAALTRARDGGELDKQQKGATYLRLANARLRSGQLIEPSEDNARFYLEAARALVPEDPGLPAISRALRQELLARAATAASGGKAADTERWLANADGEEAPRADQADIRRALQDALITARAARATQLAQSFNAALTAGRLVEPSNSSAKSYLLALMNTDANYPIIAGARQGLGTRYLGELRGALARNDFTAADSWLSEARIIGFSSDELGDAATAVAAAREKSRQVALVVGANSLDRLEYVAPKLPYSMRNHGATGWVELEFTVRSDGATSDIVVTNSQPHRIFDSAAIAAVGEWRYRPVMRDGKPANQRAAIRIRFADQ